MSVKEDYEEFLKFREECLRWQKQSKIIDVCLLIFIGLVIILCSYCGVVDVIEGRIGGACLEAFFVIVNSINGVTAVKRRLSRREADITQRETLDAIKSTFEERIKWEEEHDSLQG